MLYEERKEYDMDDMSRMNSIFPSWKVKRLIGSGSYGKVYELERVEHDAVYRSAMKVISIPQNESEIKSRLAEGDNPMSVRTYYNGVARSLLNENRMMAELKGNSNIVSYEDHQVVDHKDGMGCDIFIRMELLTSFIDYMAREKITEDTVIRLGIDICKALELCESKNIIHRDIKPGNIFVSSTGDFKLGDFGIARTIDKTTGGLSKKGTYRYMAPEVYRGEPYGRTVDIYSLGLLMYYLINGNRTPFLPEAPNPVNFDDEENALVRRMNGERLLPPKYASNGLASIILKACSYAASERYQSATQMRRELEALKFGSFQRVSGAEENLNVTVPTFPEANKGKRTEKPAPMPNTAGTGPGTPRPARVTAAGGRSHRPVSTVGAANADKKKKRLKMFGIIGGVVAIVIVGNIGMAMLTDVFLDIAPSEEFEKPISSETGLVETETEGIEVLYTDLDWDSKIKNSDNNNYYDVNIILRVHNGSPESIVGMDISALWEGGVDLTSIEEGSDEGIIHVSGYIPSGATGIMTAEITTPKTEKSKQLDKTSILIEGAETNPAIGHYEVPKGHIQEHDEDGDYYNVLINNNNGVEVSEDAVLVAVIENDARGTFEEADATGRLSQSIPANSTYKEEAAFIDPRFHEDYRDITIYAIDTKYYENAL